MNKRRHLKEIREMKDVRGRVQEACVIEKRQCNSFGTNGKELAEKNMEPEGGNRRE
jgi:hypothetical protein